MNDHLYIVAYDISDSKRWRAIFQLMHGYGEWLQLSIIERITSWSWTWGRQMQ